MSDVKFKVEVWRAVISEGVVLVTFLLIWLTALGDFYRARRIGIIRSANLVMAFAVC